MPYISQSAARTVNALPLATLPSVRRDGGRVNRRAAHAPSETTASGACQTTSWLRFPDEPSTDATAYNSVLATTILRDPRRRDPVTYIAVPATNSAKLASFPV